MSAAPWAPMVCPPLPIIASVVGTCTAGDTDPVVVIERHYPDGSVVVEQLTR